MPRLCRMGAVIAAVALVSAGSLSARRVLGIDESDTVGGRCTADPTAGARSAPHPALLNEAQR